MRKILEGNKSLKSCYKTEARIEVMKVHKGRAWELDLVL